MMALHKHPPFPIQVAVTGGNVALAILVSALLAINGYESVAFVICGMVTAVYGVPAAIGMIWKQLGK